MSLLAIGGVLLGLLALLSWLGRGARARIDRRRETVALTGQHAVHLVEIAGRRLLVGTGPSGPPRVMVELGEIEAVAEPAPTPAIVRSWAQLRDRWGGVGGR